eukprot:5045501-Amphidinium_carterae.1
MEHTAPTSTDGSNIPFGDWDRQDLEMDLTHLQESLESQRRATSHLLTRPSCQTRHPGRHTPSTRLYNDWDSKIEIPSNTPRPLGGPAYGYEWNEAVVREGFK